MKAIEQTVLNLIGGLDKVFIIPPFQRNYEWNFEQCEELFSDIETSYRTGKNHYLGNIVYFVGRNNGASYSELILVDGQQRVTSILLLLCAIRDVSDNEDIKNSINRRYLINDTGDNRFRVRLKQTAYDTQSFLSIVDKLPCDNTDNNVFKNYKRFVELVKKSDISPKDLYNAIPKLEIVDVNLQIDNDFGAVQTIFEKINSTGKQLLPADLIRNYLLLSDNAVEQEKLYQNYWIKIEQTVKSENISRFSRDYLIMNIFEDVPEAMIYKMFKNHFTESGATHVDILSDMYIFSKYFAWLKYEECPNKKINKIVKLLNFLKTDDLYPLYLYLFSKLYDNNDIELRKILNLLSDFMLRYRIVAPSGGGGAIRSVVHQLLDKLNSDEIELSYDAVYFELSNSSSPSGRYPDDTEFKNSLMSSVNVNYARALLLKIEESETSNVSVSLNEVTVEHLMPQTLSEWWIDYLGGSETAQNIHEKYLNCIGNLTPMSASYNSKNSNKSWHDKLKYLKDVQFVVTSEIAVNRQWKEDDIKKRNRDIANRACKAVTSPLSRTRKYITKNASEEFSAGLYPISDTTTPMASTDITEIIFESRSMKVSTWKDFLMKICNIAYDFDACLFKVIVEENKIHKATSKKNYPAKDPIISANPALLVNARRIGDTEYYVEGTISSTRARIYAKQLLDIYGITDAFQIYVE
ncbi:MAG: DUF262 domain-containing HNH endonuclease family protein [Ruminococcus sp.]|nr:DUF262 domain-containing HNH endonuclease family protein [Ruminococcus sp.]